MPGAAIGREPIEVKHPGPLEAGEKFLPYKRDELLSRPWALPGTKGLMHRIGGLEKQDITGNVNYEPENHQHMVNTRAKKVENVAQVCSVSGRITGTAPAKADAPKLRSHAWFPKSKGRGTLPSPP